MIYLKSRIKTKKKYFSINQLDSDVLSGVPNLIELDLGQNLINSQNFSPNAFLMNRLGLALESCLKPQEALKML